MTINLSHNPARGEYPWQADVRSKNMKVYCFERTAWAAVAKLLEPKSRAWVIIRECE